ncbi:ead/Ea22-like family protein [Klebsiella variicola]|uniref:ead/Ea22-like family protein n=1 Tax=Klebsiella variicola TaxID=244366 RepID=UPI00277B6F7D|nr:ead/Ea22-like family protein [Klebsiella variicola]
MTTDITELAQSLKAAAEKATQGNWRAFKYHDGSCGIGGGHHDEIMVCEHISKRRPHDAEFIALANPTNILALVEALEKAQQRIVELDRKNCELDSLTQRWAVERAENADHIAELESRTVKLPQRHITQFRKGFNDYHNEMAYKADEVQASLAAAGIKVEAEMKIRIVLQELKEDGVLTTYSNGHVEMLPYRIDENGEEYVEMLPNDIEQH